MLGNQRRSWLVGWCGWVGVDSWWSAGFQRNQVSSKKHSQITSCTPMEGYVLRDPAGYSAYWEPELFALLNAAIQSVEAVVEALCDCHSPTSRMEGIPNTWGYSLKQKPGTCITACKRIKSDNAAKTCPETREGDHTQSISVKAYLHVIICWGFLCQAMRTIDFHRQSETQHGDRGSLLERPNAQRCFQYKATAKRLQQRHLPETAMLCIETAGLPTSTQVGCWGKRFWRQTEKLRKLIFDSGKFPCYNPVIFTLPASAGYSSTRSIRGFPLAGPCNDGWNKWRWWSCHSFQTSDKLSRSNSFGASTKPCIDIPVKGWTGIQHTWFHTFVS